MGTSARRQEAPDLWFPSRDPSRVNPGRSGPGECRRDPRGCLRKRVGDDVPFDSAVRLDRPCARDTPHPPCTDVGPRRTHRDPQE